MTEKGKSPYLIYCRTDPLAKLKAEVITTHDCFSATLTQRYFYISIFNIENNMLQNLHKCWISGDSKQ